MAEQANKKPVSTAKKPASTTTKKTTATKAAKPVEAKVEEKPVEAPKQEAPVKQEAKKEVKAKAEKKAEAPKKVITEATATAKNVRVTPRKARLVMDLVRGKDVKVALGILANTNKASSEPVSKLIRSAVANAVNNFGMDENSLYVATIYANDGLKMKRYLPRAKGSASGLVKRDCHMTVVVKMR